MDASKVAEIIPYLLSKPKEWLVTGRGKYNFRLPKEYLLEPYKSQPELIEQRFPYLKDPSRENVNIKALSELPDLSEVNLIDMDETFSIFLSHHQRCSTILVSILKKQNTAEDFLSASVYVRDRVNPAMFAYALSVAVYNRDEIELKTVELPSFVSTHPHFFIPSSAIRDARSQIVSFDQKNRTRIEIQMQFTATNLEEEQRIAYFREDIGLNLHHWHWHLVYPHDDATYKFTGTQLPSCHEAGELRDIVDKDRRGELFYYMHQQMVARYNFERLSNKMARVRPLKDLQEPIPEGYFSKLTDTNSSKVWPARQPNSRIKSLTRELEQTVIDVDHMKRITDRILSSIDAGSAFKAVHGTDKDGNAIETSQRIALDEKKGIDILGNIVESTCLSINRDYYGDLHNMGHALLALVHDPDGRFKEGVSMMGSVQTACRDPVFWRWHAQINDLFTSHKNSLKPYTEQELRFDGVKVLSVNVIVIDCEEANEFRTFWKKDDIDISWGIDFARGEDDGALLASVMHLDHKPFEYEIEYENTGAEREGTVRIFMAPKHDESYEEFAFFHQKNLFIELDRFVQKLSPGRNKIKRSSAKSSVTIPWKQTFRSISHKNTSDGAVVTAEKPTKGDPKAYCGCGWPQHLLIPRGSGDGLDADLFVMITDTKEDKVADFHGTEDETDCGDAMSYCGLKNSLYPDKKPMGFPFDRRPRAKSDVKEKVFKLKDFLTDNMATQIVRIRFNREEPLLCLPRIESKFNKTMQELAEEVDKIPGPSAENATKSDASTKVTAEPEKKKPSDSSSKTSQAKDEKKQ